SIGAALCRALLRPALRRPVRTSAHRLRHLLTGDAGSSANTRWSRVRRDTVQRCAGLHVPKRLRRSAVFATPIFGTIDRMGPRWRYYFGWPLPTDEIALERLAGRLGVSMFGTAVTAAGHTGLDTSQVQQRIRDSIRAQRESWLWLVAVLAT